jgi:hypothetical protein
MRRPSMSASRRFSAGRSRLAPAEPVEWAMNAALTSLGSHASTKKRPDQFRWRMPFVLHQEYPSSDLGFVRVADDKAELDIFSIRIEIPSWDRPAGESVATFRRRFNAVCKQYRENHVSEIRKQKWTIRVPVTIPAYYLGLAMWKSGLLFLAALVCCGVGLYFIFLAMEQASGSVVYDYRADFRTLARRSYALLDVAGVTFVLGMAAIVVVGFKIILR